MKGQTVSYGHLGKGMSGWQLQCDHGKCDTCVPLTGWDGHRWQLACHPPLGSPWQTDRRSGALLQWRNKSHLHEVNAQHTHTHKRTHTLIQMEGFVSVSEVEECVMRREIVTCACPRYFYFYSSNALTERWIRKMMGANRVQRSSLERWWALWETGISCWSGDEKSEPVIVDAWTPLLHLLLIRSLRSSTPWRNAYCQLSFMTVFLKDIYVLLRNNRLTVFVTWLKLDSKCYWVLNDQPMTMFC